MLTNPRDAFRGQSRSPNIALFDSLGIMLMFYCNFVPKTQHFFRYSTSRNVVTLKSGSKVTQGRRNRHGSIRHLDILLTFDSNHLPILNRFRDKRRFQSKIANFPTPMYFAPSLKEFPLELGFGAWVKKLEWWGYRAEQDVCRYLQPCGYKIHQRDGRTDTGRQQRLRLRIASRGKMRLQMITV